MAKTENNQPRSLQDLRAKKNALFNQKPEEWKNALEGAGVTKVKQAGAMHIAMCCPFHDDGTPSAHLYLDKKYFKCYAGSCNKYYSDPLVFVQKLYNIGSYQETIDTFKRLFSSTSVLKADIIELLTQEDIRARRMKKISDMLHEYLLEVWSPPQGRKLFEGEQKAVDYLKKARNITDVAGLNSLGLMFKKDYLEKKQPLFDSEEDYTWTLSFLSPAFYNKYAYTIAFTYGISQNELTAFKLRSVQDKSVMLTVKDDENPLGFFGVNTSAYLPLYSEEKFEQAVVVEGEFDQLAFCTNQYSSGVFNEVVLAASGGGHAGLDALTNMGLYKARIIADDDDGGTSFVKGLLAKTQKVRCQIFNWDTSLRKPGVALDPDNAIQTYGFNRMYGYFSNDKNYEFPQRWCRKQVNDALVHVQEDDVATQCEIAVEYGKLLSHQVELEVFCKEVSEDYPSISPALIFKEIGRATDSEEAFVANMVRWFRKHFHPMYLDNVTNCLTMWHIEDQKAVEFRLDSRNSYINTVRHQLKNTLVGWAKDEIGLPSYYPPTEPIGEEVGRYDWVRGQVMNRLEDTFGLITSEVIDRPAIIPGQGLHLQGIDKPGKCGYMVNGSYVYRLEWGDAGTQLSNVVLVDGPVDEKRVFNIDKNGPGGLRYRWQEDIEKPEDFFRPPKYTFYQTYERILRIFRRACEFSHQDVDTQYVALMPFYSYLVDAMQRKVQTHLLGEFESGKSTTLSLICSGEQLRNYWLCYHASTLDNYTAPGLYQNFAGTTCLIGLDEANDHGTANKPSQIAKILEMLRGLATKGTADRNLGSKSQRGVNQALCNAIVMASGTVIGDEMDASRFNILNLIKNPRKANTQYLLESEIGAAEFAELRRCVFYHATHNAPQIARNYHLIIKEIATQNDGIMNRAMNSLVPLAAIGKAMGNFDYYAFVTEFSRVRQPDVERRASSTGGGGLVETLINSPNLEITLPGSDQAVKTTVREALRTRSTREAINESHSGVYYDVESDIMAIVWPHVMQQLLRATPYSRKATTQLQALVRGSKYNVPKDVLSQSGAERRLIKKGAVMGGHLISYISMADKVREAEQYATDEEVESIDTFEAPLTEKDIEMDV